MFRTFLFQLLFLFLLLNYTIVQHIPSSIPHWDYQRYGPDTWPHTFDTCEGEFQSPIDIQTSHVTYDSHLSSLLLNGYTTNSSIYVWNFTHNGHTIIAYPPPLSRLSISGANLPEVFYLVEFHFHWGYNAYQGSEHTINGVKFPLEIHFVHQGRSPPYAYAILSILFTLQQHDNQQLNDLLSILNQTIDASIWSEHRLDISRLFSTISIPHFYLYHGSFTEPPCTEGITWIVLAKHLHISSNQLEIFTRNSVPSNFRFPQKLYGRKVLADFQPADESPNIHHSSANYIQTSLFVLSSMISKFLINY